MGPLPSRFLILFCAATVAAAAPVSTQNPVWRMNCGGDTVAAPSGPAFLADQAYSDTSHGGHIFGTPVAIAVPIGGPANPYVEVHKTGRVGWRSYLFDVPNGTYVVRLHFAEVDTSVQGAGLRRFGLRVEGVAVLPDVDIAEMFGTQYGSEFVAKAVVNDGQLSIDADLTKDPAIVNGIEVWAWNPDSTAPPAVEGLTAKPGFHRNILTWNPVASPDVASFVIHRSLTPGGPFQPVAAVWPAPSRYLDETAPTDAQAYYQVQAMDAFGNAGPLGATVSVKALANSESAFRVYGITLDPANWKLLNEKVLTDTKFTVPGKFTYAGQTSDVELRYRGGNSRRYSKKSWKVKFPKSKPFEGRVSLNLKSHYQDLSLQREPMGNVLFQSIGHPVSTRRSIRLDVNGIDFGLYDEIEQVDENYLAAHGFDEGQTIYKVGANLAKLPPGEDYAVYYDKETNTETGYGDLISFIELLNTTPSAIFERELLAHFDVDGYLGYIAVIGWLGDPDTIWGNSYLIHDLTLDRWRVLVWDDDLGFGMKPFGTVPKTDYSIDFGTAGSVDTPALGVNVLKNRVLSVPAFRWRYCEKLKAVMAAGAAFGVFAPQILTFHASIAGTAATDVKKWGWEKETLFDAGPPMLTGYIAPRTAFLQSQIPAYQPPSPPTPIWINEILVNNTTGELDEAGDPDAWVELYNASSVEIDLGGLRLTNDASNPGLWAIQGHVVVPPGGFARIWCDGEPGEGALHTNFTLDAGAGMLALFAPDGLTVLDFVDWSQQLPGVATGRIPDGGAFFESLATPTPLTPNTNAGNLPPVITWVGVAPANPLPGESVTVSCQVVDEEGVAGVQLFWRPAGGNFTTLAMSPQPANRYTASVPGQASGTTVEYYITAIDTLGKSAKSPFGAPAELWSYTPLSPAANSICVNEVMADNDRVLTDEAGDFDDWLELYNIGPNAVDLSGMYLTDNFASPKKWKIPDGTALAAGAHLLVWCDSEPTEGLYHAAFKLDKAGESVGLFDTDVNLNGFLAGFSFGPQTTNESIGSMPDGAGFRVRLPQATPGGSNAPPAGVSYPFNAENPNVNSADLAAVDTPTVGNPFTISIAGAAPSAAGFCLYGGSTLWIPLGADGELVIWPEIFTSYTTDGSGVATTTVAIPNLPIYAGFTFYAQAFTVGSGLSGALAVTISP